MLRKLGQQMLTKLGQQMLRKIGQQMLTKLDRQLFHTIATDGRLAGANKQMFLTYTIDYVTPGRFFCLCQLLPLYHYLSLSMKIFKSNVNRKVSRTSFVTTRISEKSRKSLLVKFLQMANNECK